MPETPRRSGWDLITSRPLTEEQRRRADELAETELRHKADPKAKRKRKVER